MNKYVIGFLSLHDGELKLEQVEANSMYEAMKSYLDVEDDDLYSADIKGIYEYCSNTDCFIDVLQLNNVSRSGRSGNGLQIQLAEFDSPASLH